MRTANIHTSIIVPTRNQSSMLQRLLDGLNDTARVFPEALELIVVDNQSTEQSALDLLGTLSTSSSTPFANIQVLPYPKKFNYSAINNLAASKTDAQYLCFLNNDIEISNTDWLSALSRPMQDENTGCVGAMLYYPDNTIQHAGVYLDSKNIAGHLYKNLSKGSSGTDSFLLSEQKVSAVTAACLLVRRSVFEQVHGFNESLAVAFNDVDFCLKVRDAGYTNIWTPHAQLVHHESKSRGQKHQRTWLQKRRHKKDVKLMQSLWQHQLSIEPHYQKHVALTPDIHDNVES